MLEDDFQKYKWFYTSSGKLVIGGKNALQNDELLKKLSKEYVIMHTSTPGSPFSVILSDVKNVSKSDLEECAIFTGCFSRAWREGKKKVVIDIFRKSQISKPKGGKAGLWHVKKEIKKMKVELKLVLIRQKKTLRAVPEKSAKKKKVLLKICPGKTDKKDMLAKFQLEMDNEKFSASELLAALPAGGVRICK